MRKIDVNDIENIIEKLFIEANYILPPDIIKKIDESVLLETNPTAKSIMGILKKNYEISLEGEYPLCQDTGMAIVFLEVGQEIFFENGFINDAIYNGVEKAYRNGYLRKSIVIDPIKRVNSNTNLPPIIYTDFVNGDKLKISVMVKGFGAENQSKQIMMKPTATREEIVDFIVKGVVGSGGKACPPSVIGVGIGGTFEYSAILSKKALLRSIDQPNKIEFYNEMEKEILEKINQSGVGSQGLGGDITCFGVNILTYPTHIAGLPVAYNFCCHSCRHKSIVL